ncbi:hypothetical protein [Acidovorax sp. NCPPB 4044]|nr:hypothetical protein [Acidovorax sp. NCPPB 4044]
MNDSTLVLKSRVRSLVWAPVGNFATHALPLNSAMHELSSVNR